MKTIDKNFAVRVAGHLFTGEDIMKISIDGTDFEMEYGWFSNSEATIKCKTKDVEFVSVPMSNAFTPPLGCLATDDIEIVSPPKKFKKALVEALKGIDRTPETILVDIGLDGKQLVKTLKLGDTWYSRKCDNSDGVRFFDLARKQIEEDGELREAIKEAIREVMEEDAINRVRGKKEKFPMDRKEFEEMTKKYQAGD